MKHNSSIFVGYQENTGPHFAIYRKMRTLPKRLFLRLATSGVILAIAVVLCGLPEPAYCRTTGDPALLLQQTPAQAGRIAPEVGVHHFELNTEVTLTAVPKPGYQFVYWLGDVSDPAANSTVAYLDAPKIIIAVFERAEYEFLVEEGRVAGGPGRGGLRRSAGDYARGGGGGGGGKRPRKWRWPSRPEEAEEEPEPEPEDFPVPEEGEDDFPVPEIPEPTTVILLALGSLFAFGRRRTNQ